MPEATDQQELSVTDLLAVIRRSGIVEIEKLKKALGDLNLEHSTSEDIAARLIDRELITLWQSKQLLKARWRGYRLGKYLLLDELGRGGMAKVFLARHETLHSHVAVKVLSRARMQKNSMVERFLREARAAAQISHPNIVRVFDVDAEDDRHYLVMEYIKGWSLQDLVDAEGVLSFEKAADFTRQSAEGLARAHDSGLIHRDIKPANLLVEEGRHVKVSDFGLARVETPEGDASLTMQHEEKVLGTADYIAPEQAISSHHIDARADQYSLGYTLYFMLTGQPPFPTGRIVERLTKHCTMEPESVEKFRPDAPAELMSILHKLTRKKPEERYQRVADAAKALDDWLTHRRSTSRSGFSKVQPSESYRPVPPELSSSGADDDDELLKLAPEDDDASQRNTVSMGMSNTELEESGTHSTPGDLEVLPDDSLLDDDQDLTSGNFAFSQLLDELVDEDGSISATPAGTGSSSDVRTGLSDVHGSDVLQTRSSNAHVRDTDANRGHLPTHTSGTFTRPEALRKSFWLRMYEGMKRGEYPLWILIGAGLLLGGILIFVAYSYLSSFTPPEVPDRMGE